MEEVLFMVPSRRRLSARLSLLTFAALVATTARAEGADTIVVTATRTPVRASEVVAEVTVIDRAALERASGRTLVELLSQKAGIQFASNGGLGKTASVFMRGLEARHTLLLVDGVRVGSATVGSPSLDNLPLEAVDHIEIVRGPMSSLYGNGAMGGVIQVFLRQGGQGLTANAKATAGSHGYGQLSTGGTFGDGRFDVAAQVQRTEVSGTSATNPRVPFGSYNPDDDGFRQTGGSLRLGWKPLADWRVELLALQSRGTTLLDDGPGGDARARLKNDVVSLSGSARVAEGWRTRLAVAESTDGYDTLTSASAFPSLGLTQSKIRHIGWENTLATPLGTALVLLERQTEKVSRPGAPYSVSERDIDALALGLNGAAGPHSWNASLRNDDNSQFGNKTTGAAGYGYALTPAWRVLGSYGTSFVAPSFNQLYYPSFGNDKLRPETGKHAELGLRWSTGVDSLRLAHYQHRYKGFITAGAAPSNVDARITGTTLAYEGRWREVDLAASLDHTPRTTSTPSSCNTCTRSAATPGMATTITSSCPSSNTSRAAPRQPAAQRQSGRTGGAGVRPGRAALQRLPTCGLPGPIGGPWLTQPRLARRSQPDRRSGRWGRRPVAGGWAAWHLLQADHGRCVASGRPAGAAPRLVMQGL